MTKQRIAGIALVILFLFSGALNIVNYFLVRETGHNDLLGNAWAFQKSEQRELDQCRDNIRAIEDKTGVKASMLETKTDSTR